MKLIGGYFGSTLSLSVGAKLENRLELEVPEEDEEERGVDDEDDDGDDPAGSMT